MKVRITIDVDDYARFVIAKYFAVAAAKDTTDGQRVRATRAQVKRFLTSALKTAIKEQEDGLRGRTRGAARKLREGKSDGPVVEPLRPSTSEHQQSLRW